MAKVSSVRIKPKNTAAEVVAAMDDAVARWKANGVSQAVESPLFTNPPVARHDLNIALLCAQRLNDPELLERVAVAIAHAEGGAMRIIENEEPITLEVAL